MNNPQIIECFLHFCDIWNSFLSFSHLIIQPIHEWSCFYSASSFPMTKCWSRASSWESVSNRPDMSRGVSSFLTDCACPSRRITSWEKPGRTYRIILQEIFNRSLQSLVCLNISFPLLRRPSAVVITLWVACWREAFHKLLMVTVVGSFQLVCADIRSPRSLLFLSNCTPGILTSITSSPGLWSWGRYVRRRPCNEIHHWSRFCCDSSFSWILLRSFRHCIRAHCGTEMADIEQTQQMIPLITCEIFFG